MNETYFLHQIKHTNGIWDKGIVVKSDGTAQENFDAAKQGYHAYLGAYAYGHDKNTDYVSCHITNMDGAAVMGPEVYNSIIEEETLPNE